VLVLTSESTVEPVTLAEVKTYLRLESTDSTAEDTLLQSYITVARKLAENQTRRALVQGTYQLLIDNFENSTAVVELPRPPLSTVSTNVSITYVKDTTAGDTTTVDSTVFTVDPDSEPGRIYPTYAQEWPSDIRGQRKAITIQYVSGYTTANPVPTSILTWIKMRAAAMYENREPFITGTFGVGGRMQEVPRDYVDGLLDQYRIMTVAT
jgi:uncharacterized phiE125 gp8 family phage protein